MAFVSGRKIKKYKHTVQYKTIVLPIHPSAIGHRPDSSFVWTSVTDQHSRGLPFPTSSSGENSTQNTASLATYPKAIGRGAGLRACRLHLQPPFLTRDNISTVSGRRGEPGGPRRGRRGGTTAIVCKNPIVVERILRESLRTLSRPGNSQMSGSARSCRGYPPGY
ncbi:hypothetical protein GWI33_006211 [Rhynchophorus ferrugineus]|uniref:Uncharacterized protein n=1 Tax=Rhynchophorus ferrugineus TaxID=354439 RepID=A0A834IGH6_RHYFE|nr:hypothetical protein GWI33_006211 [Rhynchophorus ferrugineus]